MFPISIRKYEIKDRSDIRRISCETSFLEEERGYFIDDDEILSDALTLYYTDYEPESCFVALNDGHVVGYIIGTKDVYTMEKIFAKDVLPKLIVKSFSRSIWIRKNIWLFLFHIALSALKGEFFSPCFGAMYPAMFHINIDKMYRGRYIGKRLIETYVSFLKELKVSGVHFGTMSQASKSFFLKSGFALLHESKRSYLKYRTGTITPFYILGMDLKTNLL